MGRNRNKRSRLRCFFFSVFSSSIPFSFSGKAREHHCYLPWLRCPIMLMTSMHICTEVYFWIKGIYAAKLSHYFLLFFFLMQRKLEGRQCCSSLFTLCICARYFKGFPLLSANMKPFFFFLRITYEHYPTYSCLSCCICARNFDVLFFFISSPCATFCSCIQERWHV